MCIWKISTVCPERGTNSPDQASLGLTGSAIHLLAQGREPRPQGSVITALSPWDCQHLWAPQIPGKGLHQCSLSSPLACGRSSCSWTQDEARGRLWGLGGCG